LTIFLVSKLQITTFQTGSKDNEMDESTIKQNAFLAFFGRPIVGIAGSIASIIGFALSIYFFVASHENPEMTYFVHPAKAAVVRTGQASGLTIQFDGHNLTGDITATQIAFWNAGRKAIHGENVLQPLVIRTSNKTKILEARIQKASREVVGLALDNSRLSSGELGVTWKILEQNDGGVIQIIYLGDEKVEIEANAILEGQPDITRLEYARSLSTPSEEYNRRQGWKGRLGAYMMVAMSILLIVLVSWKVLLRRQKGSDWSKKDWLLVTQALLIFGMCIWVLYYDIPPCPPFGF
jgi:hypothetical protein